MIASQATVQLNLNNAAANGSAGGDGDENGGPGPATFQQRPIRNLVTYLKSKDAAGVVLLSGPCKATSTPTSEADADANKGVLYLFPPHAYSVELLQRIAPNVTSDSAAKEDYLVVVLVRGTN